MQQLRIQGSDNPALHCTGHRCLPSPAGKSGVPVSTLVTHQATCLDSKSKVTLTDSHSYLPFWQYVHSALKSDTQALYTSNNLGDGYSLQIRFLTISPSPPHTQSCCISGTAFCSLQAQATRGLSQMVVHVQSSSHSLGDSNLGLCVIITDLPTSQCLHAPLSELC